LGGIPGNVFNFGFPHVGGLYEVVLFSSTLPFVEGFDSTLATNSRTVEGGSFPTAANVGDVPTAGTAVPGATIELVGETAGVVPRTGAQMLHNSYGFNNGPMGAAYEIFLDLSAYSTATPDQLELTYWWNDAGLDNSYNSQNSCYISVDGGATWATTLVKMDGGGTEFTWNRARVGLTPLLINQALDYTDSVIIRIQSVDNSTVDHLMIDDVWLGVAVPEVEVSAGAASSNLPEGVATATPFSQKQMIGLTVTSWGGYHDLNSMTFTKTGTIADTAVNEIELWQDDDPINPGQPDGIFDPLVDISLGLVTTGFAAGQVTFSGAPLVPMGAYTSTGLWLSFSITGAVAPGTTFGVELTAAGDVSVAPASSVAGDFPFSSSLGQVFGKANSLPWATSFEGDLPYNMLFRGDATTSYQQTSSSVALYWPATTNTPIANSKPARIHHAGDLFGMPPYQGHKQIGAVMNGDTYQFNYNIVTTQFDVHMDLSSYNIASDRVLFDFAWTDLGISTSFPYIYNDWVFVSHDGGTTWHTLYRLYPGYSERYWNRGGFDLQAAMNAIGQPYTNDMIIRFQVRDRYYYQSFNMDFFDMRVVSNSLTVKDASLGLPREGWPGTYRMDYTAVKPGAVNVPMQALEIGAEGLDQTVSSIKVTKTGTIADADIAAVNIWQDDGNGRFDENSDTMLSSGTDVFAGGAANIAGLALDVFIGSPQKIFVTYDLAATATGGESFGSQVFASGDIVLSSIGSVNGTFPYNGAGELTVFQTVSTLPWSESFEGAAPPSNLVIENQRGIAYPTSSGPGSPMGTLTPSSYDTVSMRV
ncbi:MAG: hypothetical protein OEY28_11320, partial [Nitrospira sp.]|nr:hypothetical protein [Nitrospira sp.]